MGYRIRSLAVVSWQGREELADGRNRWLSKGHGKPVRVLICKLCDLFANFQTRRLWLPVPCVSRHLGIKHHPRDVEGAGFARVGSWQLVLGARYLVGSGQRGDGIGVGVAFCAPCGDLS